MVSDTNFFNFIVPNSNLTFYYQNEFGLDIEEVGYFYYFSVELS
jgi:hypothetical protein